MTVSVRVNGQAETLSAPTVAALLRAKAGGRIGPWVAVAINGTVVPRHDWESRRVEPGDEIEIVGPLSGG